jgi:predicted transcriptional regulator
MTSIKNKIEASNKSIKDLLKEQKFYIDYFQRTYRWYSKGRQKLVKQIRSMDYFIINIRTQD